MVGVHHVTPQQTLDELEALFGVPLGGLSSAFGFAAEPKMQDFTV